VTINRNGPVPDYSRRLSSCFWSGTHRDWSHHWHHWHHRPIRLSWSRAYLAIFSVCACFQPSYRHRWQSWQPTSVKKP